MHWYALRIRSNFESRVSQHLSAREVESYYPAWPSLSKRALHPMPLFPGYLFARFLFEERRDVITAPGVIEVLGHGATIPESEIEAVRLLVSRASEKGHGLMTYGYIPVGHRVRIEHGPFQGIEGIVVQHRNHERIAVSVEMIQQAVSVEVERCWLRDIDRRKVAA